VEREYQVPARGNNKTLAVCRLTINGVSEATWQSRLAKTHLTREEFQNLCVEAMQDIFSGAVIQQPAGPTGQLTVVMNGKTNTVFLDNLWAQCRSSAATRVADVQRFLRAFDLAWSAENELPGAERIVPTIKDQVYLDSDRQLMRERSSLVHEHLVGDLWIVYAIDYPDSIRTLQQSQLEKLGVKRNELKHRAIENLSKILPPIEKHGGNPYYMLTAGGDYVASLILFDDLWADLADTVEGAIVAAVPSRDVLLFTGDRYPEGIAAMRKAVDKITATGGYLVSRTMLRRQGNGWKVFS
jgi:uncharacterized protein YtpQ (UPF0354 family)